MEESKHANGIPAGAELFFGVVQIRSVCSHAATRREDASGRRSRQGEKRDCFFDLAIFPLNFTVGNVQAIRTALGEESERERVRIETKYEKLLEEGWFDAILDMSVPKIALRALLVELV